MDRTELIASAAANLRAAFSAEPTHVGVAPGRVELLGNHTDYNEGFVLTAAVDYATAVAGRRRSDRSVRLASASPDFPTVAFDIDAMERTADGTRWANYVKGVVAELRADGVDVGGFDAFVTSSVPDGSGVSSSAALLVGVARLLRALFPGPDRSPMEIARLCRRAENGSFVGAPVGLLDQFSSACGQAGHALLLDCRTLDWRAVALPAERAGILIVNTNVKHELADGGGYTRRHRECMEAARTIAGRADATLRDVTLERLAAASLAPDVMKRARHVLEENERVLQGAALLEAGDIPGFGALLTATHRSCQTLFENSCDEVDVVVDAALAHPGVYGGKLTGGGWGGSAVIVHDPSVGRDLASTLTDAFATRFGVAPTVLPTSAGAGAEAFAL